MVHALKYKHFKLPVLAFQMADQEEHTHETEEDIEDNRNYKPPPPKPLTEIVQQDAEDLSLCKYKETLLGGGLSGPIIHGMHQCLDMDTSVLAVTSNVIVTVFYHVMHFLILFKMNDS